MMLKKNFKFILIIVMMITSTMMVNAKDVFFATHRFVQNEYGEIIPKNDNAACCPTRIELDLDAKTIVIKTKTRGTASHTFSDYSAIEDVVSFYDAKGEIIGWMTFSDTSFAQFTALVILKGDTKIAYVKDDY